MGPAETLNQASRPQRAVRQVLVTGGTGYIGEHLVHARSSAGDQVRCLVRSASKASWMSSLGVELSHGDLGDFESLRRATRNCDVVYHLAGVTSAAKSASLFKANALGTHHLAQACASHTSPPLLLVVSSLAAAGTSPSWRFQCEADRAHPISNYGRSKRAGELAAADWSDRVPVSVVRPGIVFGAGNREMLPMFRLADRLRLHIAPGFSPRRLALIHHDDLIDIMQAVADCGARIERTLESDASMNTGYYFASDPEFPTYQQLGRMIGRSLGKSALVMQCVEPLAWLAAAGNQFAASLRGRTDSFNIDKMREAFAGQWTNSVERIERDLGFRFPCSLQQRINETAAWYRENNWL